MKDEMGEGPGLREQWEVSGCSGLRREGRGQETGEEQVTREVLGKEKCQVGRSVNVHACITALLTSSAIV